MVLWTLLAHYRRHPVQAVFLLISVVMANALLVGTQLINAQARAGYAEGERLLNVRPLGELRAIDSTHGVDERDYIVLRRQGFHFIAPLLRHRVRTESGDVVEVLGIDALAMPRPAGNGRGSLSPGAGFAGFSFSPYELWGSPARLAQLGWKAGDSIRTAEGRELPKVRPLTGQGLGHRLLMDIGALQALAGRAGTLSEVLVFAAAPERVAELQAALPAALEYVPAERAPDPAELTRSFHLNLAAMGLLAFVVGVFLAYNALAFSYTDRGELLRRMRLAGISRGELRRALILELVLFLLLGALVGWWLGGMLAAQLLPGVGQTLAQLYGVYISYPDALAPGGLWMPLLMTVVAGLLCVAYPQHRALHGPLLQRRAGRWQTRDVMRRDSLMLGGGLVLLIGAAVLGRVAESTWLALLGMASLLLGSALCLPFTLRVLLSGCGRLVPASRPLAQWLVADSRWLLGPAALALMAMTLALVANSGLNTMISSFRQATESWLQQRLAAQLYFRADVDTADLESWLAGEAPRVDVVERYRTRVNRRTPAGDAVAVEVVTLQDHARFRDTVTLLRNAGQAWPRFRRGEGLLVSERAWRTERWAVGDYVTLCDGRETPVLGVYHDYGNPLAQWLVSERLFRACWPDAVPASRALVGPAGLDWPALRQRVLEAFGLRESELISQAELRVVGLGVFDRTFRVTNALNALTLLVAGIGIFCAVSAIHHHRVARQALLAALGLSRRERGALLLMQWGFFGILSMVLVGPFGALLAGYLAKVVTPVAFGWSFPLRLEWQHYGALALVAASCLLLAVLLPSLRLLSISPGTMLREDAL